ncbi:MAG: ArsR/SmtB family transcription factor [Aestuariivirgaceae bacterium]
MDAKTPQRPGQPEFEAGDLEEMSKNARQASEFLKALSHESRLMILCLLMQKERSVSELEDLLGIRQSNVSQQLQRLRGERLVSTRRDGKQVYYILASEEARAVIGILYELFCSKIVDEGKPSSH